MQNKLSLYLLFITALISPYLQATEQQFKKTQTNDLIQLSYQWLDHDKIPQDLTFSLPRQVVNDQHRNLTQYKPLVAQRYIYVELMKFAKKVDPTEARIEVRQTPDDIEIEVHSRFTDKLDYWRDAMWQEHDRAFTTYLDKNYYTRFTTHLGEHGVKPDHARYIQDSHDLLLPLAQAIFDELRPGSSSRDYVNLLLSWVQSIPYDELESRLVSKGGGYLPPVQVVINNVGDCDSKTALIATLMRALLPQLEMKMVFLPGHALLGAALSARDNEEMLQVGTEEFVLLEPTGPALMKLGEISPESARALAAGQYVLEEVP